MKRMLLTAMVILAGAVFAAPKATMSLADARKQIGAIVAGEKGAAIGDVLGNLSTGDQEKFLGDVNRAVADLPASTEEKTAKFLNLDRAALKAAKNGKGDMAALVAEIFATVPPESLTVLNERYATDLFNRAANPNVTYTDEQFTKIATDLMKVVNARTAETENGSARSAFAILMLIRASNGTPADLSDKLIDTLANDEAKDLARKDWIPSALGRDGRTQGYEPLLASADAGSRPDFDFVLVIAGPQMLDSILQDITGKNSDPRSFMRTRTPVLDAIENPLGKSWPPLSDGPFGDALPPQFGGNAPDGRVVPQPQPQPRPRPEPGPYDGTGTFY